MSNSLSDQLLKAGLVTQEQVEKAAEDKKKRPKPASRNPKAAKGNKRPQKQQNQRSNKPSQAKTAQERDDLEKYYKAFHEVERKEKAEEEQRKREAAARKKRTRKQIRDLIEQNTLNQEEADVRYNFAVGSNVKHVYVTKEQQEKLASGEFAVTFMDGKRCVITTEVGQQILALDAEKIVIIAKPDEADIDIPDVVEGEETA